MEKDALLRPIGAPLLAAGARRSRRARSKVIALGLLALTGVAAVHGGFHFGGGFGGGFHFGRGGSGRGGSGRGVAASVKAPSSWCPLPPVVPPPTDDGLLPSEHLMSAEQRALQVERLGAAVRVPTQSFDDSGDVDTDPRYAPFDKFHAELARLFPLVHARLQLEKVNRYGLLYTLTGNDSTTADTPLKPIVFMAHQDVVPADVQGRGWTYPPFSGHYDGDFLWGRGAADCKSVLVGILSALEALLAQSAFAPRRSVILAFGFDEEIGGRRGAGSLSRALRERWGEDGHVFLWLLDEGGMGLVPAGNTADGDGGDGVIFAYPGVGEKGYFDLRLTLSVPGGHSSRPPQHTGIGIMADLVHALEAGPDSSSSSPPSSFPFSPRLPQSSPYRRVLECRARYAPDDVPAWLPDSLAHDSEAGVAHRLGAWLDESGGDDDERWLMQTSQAVDVIEGGIKVNALPERVSTIVNYRVALHESAALVVSRARAVLEPVARRHGLVVVDEIGGGDENEPSEGQIERSDEKEKKTLSLSSPQHLGVAPLSPTSNSAVWTRFAGTLRSVFETTTTGHGHTVVPVGNIQTGNTDTAHFWALSHNIYRFTPSRAGTRFNTHTVDERIEITAHLEGIRFYYDLIRNFNDWKEE